MLNKITTKNVRDSIITTIECINIMARSKTPEKIIGEDEKQRLIGRLMDYISNFNIDKIRWVDVRHISAEPSKQLVDESGRIYKNTIKLRIDLPDYHHIEQNFIYFTLVENQ